MVTLDKNIHLERFRLFLNQTLETRKKKNELYSIRSFAKSLGVDSSSLSAIIRGKRKLTSKMILRLGNELNLAKEEIDEFLVAPLTQKQYQQYSLDVVEILSEWYYDAIIELSKTHDFIPQTEWISKKLGLEVFIIQKAIYKLEENGFLEISNNKWSLLILDSQIQSNNRSVLALKEYQNQVLELSKKKLASVPVEKRFHSNMTMAINKSQIPYAKSLLRSFRTKFDSIMQNQKELDDVYILNLGFFPVTEQEEKETA